MNKALKEALSTVPEGPPYESEALKQIKETVDVQEAEVEKWLILPRKYTRRSARFGLPINTNLLESISDTLQKLIIYIQSVLHYL